MSKIRPVIESLQESGLVVQGLPMDQIERLLSSDERTARAQFTALISQGRQYGVYLYQDQASFDHVEFARKLGEIGFGKEDAQSVIANLRPAPTPELTRLGDRD